MKDIVIYGAGGLGREVHELIQDINEVKPQWNFLGFLDGAPDRHGLLVHDCPVLGGEAFLEKRPQTSVVVAIGNPRYRRKVVQAIMNKGFNNFATLVHPTASVGRRVIVDQGSIIMAASVLTTDIQVGMHVVINPGCTVGHDSCLHDFTTLAPGVNVAGTVRVGEGADLGINSTVIQGRSIGEWSILGAGAVVVNDLPSNITAVGVPAKAIKERLTGWHL